MKDRINKNTIYFTIIFIIILFVSFEFTKGFAVIDHYNMFDKGYVRYAIEEFFKDGRIVSGVYIIIADLLKIKIQNLYIFSNILGLIIVTFNILYLKNVLKNINKSNKEWQWLILALITVFNWTCVNNLHYIEFPIISLSIFLYIFSAKKIIINKKIKTSLITVIIAMFCYQGTMSAFFSSVVLFELMKNEDKKEKIKNIFKGCLLGVISVFINFVFIKIYGNIMELTTRTEIGMDRIIFNIRNLWKSITTIILYNNLALPKYLSIIFLLIIFLTSFLYIKKNKKILQKIILIFICNIIASIPLMISFYAGDIYISGRLLWSIGAIIGMCLIILYSEIKNINWQVIVIYLAIVYMILQLLGMYKLVYRYKIGNEIDKSIVSELEELRIKASEENQIKKIIIKEEFTRKWIASKIQKLKPYKIIYFNFNFT